MRPKSKISLMIALMFAGTSANAAFVVDTGTPTGDTNYSLFSEQNLAGYFTIGSATTISSVEGFIGGGGGMSTITIYSDAPLPNVSNTLFTASFATVLSPNGIWQGTSGQSWALGAGNYWVGFTSTGNNYMANLAPNPLANYAFENSGPWRSQPSLTLGIRLADAANGAVPEPATWAMMIGGFGAIGGAMRYRRKVSVSFA